MNVLFGHGVVAPGIDTPAMLLWDETGKIVAFRRRSEVSRDGGMGSGGVPVPRRLLDTVAFGNGKGGGAEVGGIGSSVTGEKVIVVLSNVTGGRGGGRTV